MTVEVSSVALGVDTTQVVSASTALDNMAKAGARAETASSRLERAHAAMIGELKGIRSAVSDLANLTTAEGRAATAASQRSKASAAAALAGLRASNAIKAEAKAMQELAPAANQGAGAIGKLSLAADQVRADGIKEVRSELTAAATQASRTMASIEAVRKKANASAGISANRAANQEEVRAAREAARVIRAANQEREAEAKRSARVIEREARRSADEQVRAERRTTAAVQKAARDAANEQAKAARSRVIQGQQLGFQLQDFFVQVSSGGNPVTALIQQGSQLSGTFGGAGNALKAVIGLLTPARVAIGGLAGSVGALTLAFIEGRQASKAFGEAITLTGNFAGQTEGRFNAEIQRLEANSRATIGQAREAAQAIAATGEIGPQVFAQATEAAALYSKATGKTADEVAKDFAEMSRAPTRFASEANRSLNFLTAAQYESIRAFEAQGNAVGAQEVIFTALISRLRQLDGTMDWFDRQLNEHNKFWSGFWDTVSGVGRATTVEDELRKIDAAIKAAETRTGRFAAQGLRAGGNGAGADVAALESQRRDLLKKQFRQQENADAEALRADINKRGIAAGNLIEGYAKAAKATDVLKQKTKELNKAFDDSELAGVAVSKQQRADALAGLQKQFGPSGSGVSEAGQLLRAALDRDLKSIQDLFIAERDSIAFNERFLQGEYQAGNASLEEFYKGKREAIERGTEAEVSALERENTRLAQFIRQSKDPSERAQTQTRIDENVSQIERARIAAAREQRLINQDEAASFRALGESILGYQANLLQLQGDELGAAQKRAEIVIQNARILAKQSESAGGGRIDVEGLARATQIQNDFNEVQRRSQALSQSARTAEEAFIVVAEQRGLSLRKTEEGLFRVRQEELRQLKDLSDKAKELAEASTDPRIKQFAADMALEYAKAANAVDPALNRLREANRQLAADLTGTIANLPQSFADAYAQRRADSFDDIKNQKDEYNRRIDILEGYLAESQDKQDKARLRAKIKDLEERRDAAKRDSKGSTLFKALNDSFIQPAAQQVLATANRVLIADPLQKMIEAQLKSITEGDGLLSGFFKDALGIKADPKDAALAAQTAAITSSTSALTALEIAARGAANGLGSRPALGAIGAPPPVDSELPGFTDDFGTSLEDSTDATDDFSKTVPTATNVITKLAASAAGANQSLALMPSIINLIQAASATSSASSSGGGFFGLIASMFSKGGSSGGGAMSNEVFHSGGIVGMPAQRRMTASSVMANAQRYHKGGLAGLRADEVPAILMGGPKGKREEVLRADDPRHRDNLGMNVLARIMAESKREGLHPRGSRAMGGLVSAGSMYRVNENKPELLRVAGKQYLMMGNQSGAVDANPSKGNPQINLTMNFNTGGAPVDRRNAEQAATIASASLRRTALRNG